MRKAFQNNVIESVERCEAELTNIEEQKRTRQVALQRVTEAWGNAVNLSAER